MAGRLKSFELHGYKTFATRSEFQFSDGITAIVGPNGSGKSNIADALRWVLGEQSYGLLRGKKTEDMIFSGSENRSRAGMASATIVFNNSDGWLPIDFVEVGITRRAYRDGENEYLLNGQRVRLKDVSEVLAKSGLAERTYTVIGQGLVDAALALRAEDRRRLFEEAAGIGLHRARREEALKRLDNTRRNLERVNDILAELQPRLKSLERQAKRAIEHNQMKDELKVTLRQWYGYHWHKSQAELVQAQADAKAQEESLSSVQSSQHELDQKLANYRSRINELRIILNERHKELTLLHQKRETLSRDQAVSIERARLLHEQLESLSRERLKAEEGVGIQADQVEASANDLSQLEKDLSEAQHFVIESAERLIVRQQERSIVEGKLKANQREIERITNLQTQTQALLSEKEIQINRLRDSVQKVDKEIATRENELSTAQLKKQAIEVEQAVIKKQIDEISNKLIQIQEEWSAIEVDRKLLSENITAQKTKNAQLQAEYNVLNEAEKNLIGHDEGARLLLGALKNKQLDGAIGSLGNSLSVPEEYETAIAAVLGEYIDSLIVDSITQTDRALDLIVGETIRGSLLPLDVIKPNGRIAIDIQKAAVDPTNVIGIAAQFVKADEKLTPIIDLLFGNVIIVKDRKTARSLLSSRDMHLKPDTRLVTLKGEMYLASGPITSGASAKSLLARPRRQREIISTQADAIKTLSDLEFQLNEIDAKLIIIRNKEIECKEEHNNLEAVEKAILSRYSKQEQQIDRIQHDLQWQRSQKAKYQNDLEADEQICLRLRGETNLKQTELEELTKEYQRFNLELAALPLNEIETQNKYWSTNAAVIERAVSDSRNRHQDMINLLNKAKDELMNIENRLLVLDEENESLRQTISNFSVEEKHVATQIEEVHQVVDPYEDQLSILERDHTNLLTSDTNARQLLRSSEQQYTQAKINLAHHRESFESLRRHIEDDFGLVAFDYNDTITGAKPLPLEGMIDELPVVEELPIEIEENIRQKKAQIRRLGAINFEAQLEYKEVKERFEFLSTQLEDLSKAEIDIRQVITELDLLMEREFRRTFDEVSQEFKQIFTRLFGGGSARLALTNPENVTETGIDIEARLPGRREQGLSLLSGGERSLTATALIFALLRVSPTPFCILDEVDAMLDEANVSRFRDMLTELSKKTQFIVITHNRNTVQAASIIYGVTMGRDSASQVISLRMDEVGEEFGV